MYQNNNNFHNELVFENTVDGRIIPVRDGEAIVFEITINPFKIVCIANIPEEGKVTAPVYLKFKMNDGRNNIGGFRKRFSRDPRFNNRGDVPVEYKNGEPPQTDDGDDNSDDDDGGKFSFSRS
jgi:hypothetical protein